MILDNLKFGDLSVEVRHNGTAVSAIIGNQLVERLYIGYSIAEAVSQFKEEFESKIIYN